MELPKPQKINQKQEEDISNDNSNEEKKKEQEEKIDWSKVEITPRSFDQNEIHNLNYYVTNQIPHSILPRLFILSENPEEKCDIFLTIFAIVESAMFYLSSEVTKQKIQNLLNEVRDIYDELNELHLEKKSSKVSVGNYQIDDNIVEIIKENSQKINKLRSIFLIFAEKQELIDLDKVTGVNTDIESGKDIYNKLGETLDS